MNYGRAIRMVRAARGTQQKDVAREAKLDQSYVSLVESGARAPSPASLRALAAALDVPLSLLELLAVERGDAVKHRLGPKLGEALLAVLTEGREDVRG